MSPDGQFWWSWAVQLLIGLSTLGAVIVALFGNWFRYRLVPPKLSIRLLSETGEETDVTFMLPDQPNVTTKGRWYHIRVHNARRWIEAAEVQVYLLRIEEPDPSGQFNAHWDGAIPLEWRHMRSLNPAATRTFGHDDEADLVALLKRGNTTMQPFFATQTPDHTKPTRRVHYSHKQVSVPRGPASTRDAR